MYYWPAARRNSVLIYHYRVINHGLGTKFNTKMILKFIFCDETKNEVQKGAQRKKIPPKGDSK